MTSKVSERKNKPVNNTLSDEEQVVLYKKELDAYATKIWQTKEIFKSKAFNENKEKEKYKILLSDLKQEYNRVVELLQESEKRLKEQEEKNKIRNKVDNFNNVVSVSSISMDDEIKEFEEKCKKESNLEIEKELQEFRKMYYRKKEV